MKLLLQRVRAASVEVQDELIASIDRGLLVFCGLESCDEVGDQHTLELIKRKVRRLCHYRVFADDEGKMNLSCLDKRFPILLVSQFTLAADTNKGLRPSFSSACPPDDAKRLFETVADLIEEEGVRVKTGCFGADMQIALINDGPVTFLL